MDAAGTRGGCCLVAPRDARPWHKPRWGHREGRASTSPILLAKGQEAQILHFQSPELPEQQLCF